MKFVAITACPTGIAHTYMAAESLEQTAKANGDEIVVETQGSAGSEPLSAEDIASADAVIFAADLAVQGRDRFAGKPIVDAPVKAAINDAAGLFERAKAAAREPAPATPAAPELTSKVGASDGAGTKLRQWLMTGVSYLIPFVAAGGLLIALSFALGGYKIVDAPKVTEHFDAGSVAGWAALMFQIGSAAFDFLVPVLAGFIAFAMADRPAIAPGFVGGAIAVTVHAGFLGGLVAGLLAGGVVLALKKIQVPKAMRGIMPVVVYPLLGSIVVGVLMYVVVGKPMATVTMGLTSWLNSLSGVSALLLGALLGLMMAFDMGGPVNKAAYAFAVGGLTTGATASLQIMAAVMAAGMVPPLALALASTVRKKLFTEAERENGRAAWLLGASFITEGAIPFAAADPFRVIPSIMLGSAVTGSLSMAFGTTLRAPHGGIFVLPLIGNPLLFLVALIAGTVVAAGSVIALKQGRFRAAERSSAVSSRPVNA
ncbi:PTS system, fructose-specific IIBC component [Amycolatopsis mediterranei S699]|uniref:PTS system, fructose-specific IIBC component n=2 Tax=Amycolatopsis mediterranei TaxID=33910 RepID=A0A0H3D9Q9_AMYMU|nr:fructose-specific PTS transporter subunit EIIC [Amycolatopsis mediterranei]ADJ46269.1 PTS system, fructose-specific IIBC component [Amycolatopsis mediterranei U32]AEK43062.1 PTS system, fructose-specific IIBC component [Amycolatopsis mediterranei S699]AFO77980.1 PTS system, fructose-specific IIBC component [Amycolatopsis mediterranei S699]AGT85108.1 PTS system, fructose-specific IIBC component [Amycolatopsis mediterranei RB]KDO05206.1 PTS fructose transporter subunit IIBC [Amycolatopsis med